MMFTVPMARTGYSANERAAKRQEILDAAMQVFETQGGISAVSFRSVAAILGCSYSAPYRYFSGKDELIVALRARAYRWMEQALISAVDPLANARTQLEAVAHAYIRAGMDRPTTYALMYFELAGSDLGERSLELKAAKRAALGVCADVITAGQAAGTLPAQVDALTAAHMFWIGAHGLVSLHVGSQFVMGRTTRELIPSLIQWLGAGMEYAVIGGSYRAGGQPAKRKRIKPKI
jgi:AcrR family transcriptional regulator